MFLEKLIKVKHNWIEEMGFADLLEEVSDVILAVHLSR